MTSFFQSIGIPVLTVRRPYGNVSFEWGIQDGERLLKVRLRFIREDTTQYDMSEMIQLWYDLYGKSLTPHHGISLVSTYVLTDTLNLRDHEAKATVDGKRVSLRSLPKRDFDRVIIPDVETMARNFIPILPVIVKQFCAYEIQEAEGKIQWLEEQIQLAKSSQNGWQKRINALAEEIQTAEEAAHGLPTLPAFAESMEHFAVV